MEKNSPEDPILRRAYLFLEEKDWENAYAYADKALDASPENYRAYLCKLLCELSLSKEDLLGYVSVDFSSSTNYKNAIKFANSEQLEFLQHALESAKKYNAKKSEIGLVESKIKNIENKIYDLHKELDDKKGVKKGKIVGGLYLLFPVIFIAGLIVAVALDLTILLAVFLPIGFIGMLVLHAIMSYIDETDYRIIICICCGLINSCTFGIWGIVKAIKLLAVKAPTIKKDEANRLISKYREEIEQYKKELIQMKKGY